MLSELYTLAEKYADRRIYIWEINRDSMMVFSMFAYKRIDICGFVTTKRQFWGETIMNRTVYSIIDIAQQPRSIVVMADVCTRSEIENTLDREGAAVEIIAYSDCLNVDYRLRDKKVILYGMGRESKKIEDILDKTGIQISGYALTCVTEQDRASTEKIVYGVEELPKADDIVVIIAVAPRSKFQWEIFFELERKWADGNIYFNDTIIPALDIGNSITFPLIDMAYKEGKKIYIYGETDRYGRILEDIFNIYGIPCSRYIRQSDLYDMYYEGFEDKLFVINAIHRITMEKKCDELEKLGISLDNFGYTGICWVNTKVSVDRSLADCLVGHMPLYTDFNGINIHGSKDAKVRIVVLGGSTSTTRYFRAKSWVDFFYERINKEIGDIVIYNFANFGNDVVIELLKLIRDGYHVKPGYVISLSGVNNKCYKDWTINQFNVTEPVRWLKKLDADCNFNTGLEIKEEMFSFWVRIQKSIKAVAEIYGARYLGVLQPMNIGKKNKNMFETMVFEEDAGDAEKNIKVFREQAKEDDLYLNLLTIFDDTNENMYTDQCHYTEKANQIIAEKITDALLRIM